MLYEHNISMITHQGNTVIFYFIISIFFVFIGYLAQTQVRTENRILPLTNIIHQLAFSSYILDYFIALFFLRFSQV
jgi:hypothetical protein